MKNTNRPDNQSLGRCFCTACISIETLHPKASLKVKAAAKARYVAAHGTPDQKRAYGVA